MDAVGWCHEFGVTVREECGHPMQAGASACSCPMCGVVCEGQFAGCATVWANGPRPVSLVRPEVQPTAPGSGQRPSYLAEPVVGVGASPVPSAAASPSPAGPAGTDVLGWLQESFDGLHARLRVISDAVSRQQESLTSVSEVSAVAARLSELSDTLPDRIGEAVREALAAGRSGEEGRLGPDGGAAMPPAAPVGPPAEASADHQPPGIRTQLTTLASTIQSRLDRSGWQARLRALRPANESQPPVSTR